MYHYTGSGLSNVWLVNGYTEHSTPYGLSVSIADIDGLHQAISLEIANLPVEFLFGETIKFLRVEMDLSQQELADFLGIYKEAVRVIEEKPTNAPPPMIFKTTTDRGWHEI